MKRLACTAVMFLTPAGLAAPGDQCGRCHPSEVQNYAQSPMQRSLSTDAPQPNGRVEHKNSASTILIDHRGNQMVQRLDSNGLRLEYPVAYAVGDGKAGYSYLVRIGEYLFQSPVSFYSQSRTWDLTPGYEPEQVLDFTHPISEGCIFCHSGSANLIAGSGNRFAEPALQPISCDRCHGPVEAHLKSPVSGSIVNPAKLPQTRRDSVCEQCHLEGEVRILNPGKRWFDFQAGANLESVFVTYVRQSEGVKAVSQSEQLALSRCSRESEGRLWCASCHNPHAPKGDRAQVVRTVCLTCHAALLASGKHKPADECTSCHMPRLRPTNVAHTAITDHRISTPSARKSLGEGSKSAELSAWRQPEPNLVQRDRGLALFQASLSSKTREGLTRGYDILAHLSVEQRSDPDVLAALAAVLLAEGRQDLSVNLYSKAVSQRPGDARLVYCLAAAYAANGDSNSAIKELQKSIQLDPSDPDPYIKLASVYEKAGRKKEAREALRSYLQFMPQNLAFRRRLGE
jgi:hypothetical protein